VGHYEQPYVGMLISRGILKVMVKVATFSSFLRLNHETLIRNFNEDCHVFSEKTDPLSIAIANKPSYFFTRAPLILINFRLEISSQITNENAFYIEILRVATT